MNKAFSLVELSIVLVILGLLTGGILGGQSLIRAAELRAATTEYNRFVTAAQTFRDKYFAIPGDMTNAQSFWGVAHATPATCKTTVGTGTQTCNGDGNGQIENGSAGSNELFRLWQHLANAGLIEGNYTGVQGAGAANHTTTDNAPRSRIANGFWFAAWQGTSAGFNVADDSIFAGDYGNYMELGASTANFHPQSVLLKPEELWNIDTKMDDGRPALGRVIARRWDTCTNAASATDTAANYRLDSTAAACVAIFMRAF